MSNKTNASMGCLDAILALLQVVFIVLKLVPGTPIYFWSWWLVLVPLWIGIAFVVAIFLIALLIAVVAWLID
jgi:hypothetical protein